MFYKQHKTLLLGIGAGIAFLFALFSFLGRQHRADAIPLPQTVSVDLLTQDAAKAFQYRIPPGTRAFALPLDSALAAADIVKQYNFVDLIASFEVESGSGERENQTVTLVQNVEVLALSEDKKFVTVALTPKDAQRVAFAKEKGGIQVVLRPFADDEIQSLEAANTRNVLGVDGIVRSAGAYREYRGMKR